MRLGGAAHDRWLRDCVMPHSSNPNVARAARRTAPIGPSPPNRGSWPRVGDQRGNEDRETGQREPGELGGGGGEDQCVATHEYSGGGGCGQEQGQVQDVHRVGGHVHGLAAPDPGAAIRSGMISHSHSSVKSVRRATSFDSCPWKPSTRDQSNGPSNRCHFVLPLRSVPTTTPRLLQFSCIQVPRLHELASTPSTTDQTTPTSIPRTRRPSDGPKAASLYP